MKNGFSAYLRLFFTATLLGSFLPTTVGAALAGSTFKAPRLGAPGNREAGGARSDTCASTINSRGLTAVLPSSNLGLTTQAYPTFYAYIPPNNAETAEFRLIEESSGKEVFVGQVSMLKADEPNAAYKHKASVLGMTLPEQRQSTGLQVGQSYLWALMLVCNANNRAEDIVVTGVVQRIGADYVKGLAPETAQQLNTLNRVSAQEKLAIYGAAGIWQDLLADVATLRQTNATTYGEEWRSLLTDQGLGAIATIPVVEGELVPIQP
jgi:hypothetical protein